MELENQKLTEAKKANALKKEKQRQASDYRRKALAVIAKDDDDPPQWYLIHKERERIAFEKSTKNKNI